MTPINKLDPAQQKHYPVFEDRHLHDEFRIVFDHIYELQHQLGQAHSKIGELEKVKASPAVAEVPNGPSNTKIAGLYVAGVPPTNGQKLTYNSSTGQIEWQ